MKKVWIGILMLVICLPVIASAETAQTIGITFDGERKTFDQTPRKIDGSVFVPVRAVFDAFGATMIYQEETQTAEAVKGDTTVVLTVGEKTAIVDNRKVELQYAPEMIGGRMYVPIRSVSELLGGQVLWQSDPQTVHIFTTGVKTGADLDFLHSLKEKTADELNKLLHSHITDEAYFHEGKRDLIKVRFIIGAGADIHEKVEFDTPLDVAVRSRDLVLTKLLLLAGADPNARAFESRSILSRVVNPWYTLSGGESAVDDNSDLLMLDLLLDYGADPNQVGTSDFTKDPVLLSAIIWNRIAIAGRLLEAGAYVDAHPDDPARRMPLQYAVYHDAHLKTVEQFGLDPAEYPAKHPEIVKLLLENGAKANITVDGTTTTLLEYARSMQADEAVVRLLEDAVGKN